MENGIEAQMGHTQSLGNTVAKHKNKTENNKREKHTHTNQTFTKLSKWTTRRKINSLIAARGTSGTRVGRMGGPASQD